MYFWIMPQWTIMLLFIKICSSSKIIILSLWLILVNGPMPCSRCNIGISMNSKWVITAECFCISIILIRQVINWLICLWHSLRKMLNWLVLSSGIFIVSCLSLVMLYLTFGAGWKMTERSWINILKGQILLLTILIILKKKPNILFWVVALQLTNRNITRSIKCVIGMVGI